MLKVDKHPRPGWTSTFFGGRRSHNPDMISSNDRGYQRDMGESASKEGGGEKVIMKNNAHLNLLLSLPLLNHPTRDQKLPNLGPLITLKLNNLTKVRFDFTACWSWSWRVQVGIFRRDYCAVACEFLEETRAFRMAGPRIWRSDLTFLKAFNTFLASYSFPKP